MVPRVFISYAQGVPAHESMVEEFWHLLRAQGVDALLDRGIDDPGHNWRRWMEQEIPAADFVLVIASPEYRAKAAREVPEDPRPRRCSISSGYVWNRRG